MTAVVTRGEARVFDGPVDPAGTIVRGPARRDQSHPSVLDGTGDIIDREAKLVDVPDPEASPLWITSPALFRAQNVREFRGLERGPTAMPFPGREFVRTDRLVIQLRSARRRRSRAPRSRRASSASGARTSPSCRSRRAQLRTRPYELELPLATVARGDYPDRDLSVESAADHARAFVPIRILR